MNNNFYIKTKSTEETQEIAFKIADFFVQGNIIILDGDLGAGKTHFVKGFAKAMLSENEVTSPTFSIANFYKTKKHIEILHIDLYRLETVEEFINLGINDYFQNHIVLIEWGKQFVECFDDYLLISIKKGISDGERIILFNFENTNNFKLENIITILT